jgi:hypothetical protein
LSQPGFKSKEGRNDRDSIYNINDGYNLLPEEEHSFFDPHKLKSLLRASTGPSELTQRIRSQLGIRESDNLNESFTSIAPSEKSNHYRSTGRPQSQSAELTLEERIL